MTRHLEITQEEIGALSGISRQNANQCLKRLEKEGLLRLEYGGVTVVDLERLRHHSHLAQQRGTRVAVHRCTLRDCSPDLVAADLGSDQLADHISVGEANDQSVLGSIVFVL